MELLPLLCLCLLTRSGITSGQLNGPKNITVEGGTDVVLPCSLSTKENITSKLFDWRKDAQKDDGLKEVFLYDSGIHYNNGRGGQSEEFKGRVSHFPDELKHGNASIIIRNTKISDSGEYTCYFPRLRPPQTFYIELVVEPIVITVKEDSDVVLPCSLSTKDITSKVYDWKKVAQKDDCQKEVFYYNGGIDHKNCFPGQVSHFPDELKHGNASIIFRNAKVTDSGVYTCDFPNLQPRNMYTIKLVVDGVLKDRSDENIPGAASKPKVAIQARVLQCEVHGNPKPKVELQDSAGNILDAKVTQDSEREGSFYITLQTKVTKTDTYRCEATQEKIKHQIHVDTYVHISGLSTGSVIGLVLGIVALLLVVAAVLAGLVNKGYIPRKIMRGPKVITVEEGSDAILPCFLWPKEDLRSIWFGWKKTDNQMLYICDNGRVCSDDLSGRFKGRVSHFPHKLEQGNASIIIRNTRRTDSGDYRCDFTFIQKHLIFSIKLVVVGPKVIKVEEGSDVTLPCSLITKEDIRLTQFVWEKVSQTTDDIQKVFLYDKGDLYSDERPGQSEQFKGRVSHFPDKLEQGNASIIIRNTTRADSGDYRCSFPFIQKPQEFYIKLDVVDTKIIKVKEGADATLPCSLGPKEDLQLTWFVWEKTDDGQKVFLCYKGDLYSDGRPGRSEQFKDRVSHFPDELKQGNASIIIRNTTRADSGVYRCSFPFTQKPQEFYIKLDVVVGSTPESDELHPLINTMEGIELHSFRNLTNRPRSKLAPLINI